MDLTPLNFDIDDLGPIEIPIRIQGKDYVLKEATGDVARRYENHHLRMIAITKDGANMKLGSRTDNSPKVSEEGMADADSYLVSLCLFEVTISTRTANSDEGLGKVALSWVRGLPNRILSKLIDKVKYISNIGQPTSVTDIDEHITALSELRDRLVEEGDKSVPKDKPASMQATSD